MKKLICIIMTFVLALSFTEPVLAARCENEVGSIAPYFSETEAADIALIFVMKNIGTGENNWSMDTVVDEVYALYDFDDNVTGYTFKLSTDGLYSGYITVSANQDTMPIQEFSFTDVPIFEEKLSEETLEKTDKKNFKEKNKKDRKDKKDKTNKIVINGPLEYYINESGYFYDLNEKSVVPGQVKKIQRNDEKAVVHNKKLKELIADSYMGKEYSGQLEGYAISDHIAYMADRYTNYNYERGYTTKSGTNPTIIDNIVEDVFKKWGYTVEASNTYIWTFNTFVEQINQPNYNPLLFNIATGYYASHTVTVIGYRDFDVADFLLVKDNWSTSTRYIHWQQMWNEVGSVTVIEG